MPDKRRMEQINSLIREEIGDIQIHHGEDRVLASLTVTEVRTSPDLSHARVFVMIHKPGPEEKTLRIGEEELRHVAEKVQRLLAPRLRIRRTPRLQFVPDDTEERAQHIEDLLRQVKDDWENAERNP